MKFREKRNNYVPSTPGGIQICTAIYRGMADMAPLNLLRARFAELEALGAVVAYLEAVNLRVSPLRVLFCIGCIQDCADCREGKKGFGARRIAPNDTSITARIRFASTKKHIEHRLFMWWIW